MHDWLSVLGIAMGSAWTSGVNLYATVATLGLAQRLGFAHLPGDLTHLGDWRIIGAAAILYAIEFIADKVPAVDSVWDAIHTFIRIPAGAVLAASAFANFPPEIRILATLAGGSVALASHGTKATTRLAVNTSPEPFSNIVVSILEDVFVFAATVMVILKPIVILVAVMLFMIAVVLIAPKVFRALRNLFRFRRRRQAAAA